MDAGWVGEPQERLPCCALAKKSVPLLPPCLAEHSDDEVQASGGGGGHEEEDRPENFNFSKQQGRAGDGLPERLLLLLLLPLLLLPPLPLLL